MKITDIRIQRYRLPLDPPFNAAWDPNPRDIFDATLVFVETDAGITGVGSGDTMDGFEPYKGLFIGEDPRRIMPHVQRIETLLFHGGRYWPLEAALWDIIGKAAGLPVSHFFGNYTDKILAYASCGELKPPAERAGSAQQLRDEGFKAMKIRIERHAVREGIDTVQAVREGIGDEMDIMVDYNQAWQMPGDISPTADLKESQYLADALGELGVYWLEEPLQGNDAPGLHTLRVNSKVRIAGGEMVRSLPELLAYVEHDSLDVYQPDVVLAMGMLRVRMLAELVIAKNRTFTPHTWSNGIGVLANLHVTCGVGGGPYLEFPYDPPNWSIERRDFIMAEPLAIDREGYVHIPDAPGLGATVDEAALEQYRLE